MKKIPLTIFLLFLCFSLSNVASAKPVVPAKSNIKLVDDQEYKTEISEDEDDGSLRKIIFSDGTTFKKINAYLIVNGSFVTKDLPVIENGRTLVPVKVIADGLGVSVNWNGAKREVLVSDGSKTVNIRIGSNIAVVNGKSIEMDVPAKIINEKTYVPLRFISENFGAEVGYDNNLFKDYDDKTGRFIPIPIISVERQYDNSVSVISPESALVKIKGLLHNEQNSAKGTELYKHIESINVKYSIGRFYVMESGVSYAQWDPVYIFDKYTGQIFSYTANGVFTMHIIEL